MDPSPPIRLVRRVIEWGSAESGDSDTRRSPAPPKAASARQSPLPKPKLINRVAEARALLCKVKTQMKASRNTKREIVDAVVEAAERLYQLVKEENSSKSQGDVGQPQQLPCPVAKPSTEKGDKEPCVRPESLPTSLEGILAEHMKVLQDNSALVRTLSDRLEKHADVGGHDGVKSHVIEGLLGEVRELRQTTEATGRKVSTLQEAVPSYAEVLARPSGAVTPNKLRPKHSIIVSSDDELATSEVILGRVREALDAKTSGLQVTRVQKVKFQKLVLSCDTKEEIKKVSDRITAKNKTLKIEEARNKDPLIIIKNILSVHKDEEIVASLKNQNASLLGALTDNDFRAVVKYRRKARNPHENHVVLQVSPMVWQKLTAAKRVHVDLQYATVQDQSPLVQCTRCLGYGHGRKLCTEPVDLCSFCAGPHHRAVCPAYTMGETATCRNCRLAKFSELGHNAFDGGCPVRKRWDAIARCSVAYC